MTYLGSTLLNGVSSGSWSFAAPSGITYPCMLTAFLYTESATAITSGSGFTKIASATQGAGSEGSRGRVEVWQLYVTSAPTFPITFSGGSAWRTGALVANDGRDLTIPSEIVVGNSAASGSTSSPAVSGTASAGADLLFFSSNFDTVGSWTPPSGFTERADQVDWTLATQDNVTAGATGSVTATHASSQAKNAILVSMAPAPSPMLVADYETVWNTTTTPKTVSVTTAPGDLLVSLSGAGDSNAEIAGVPPTGGTGLSWVEQTFFDSGNNQQAENTIYTAESPIAQTFTYSRANAGATQWFGSTVVRLSNHGGIGNAQTFNNGNAGSSAPSASFTTQYDNSAIVVLVMDWAAADGASRAYLSVNGLQPVEATYSFLVSTYTAYVYVYKDVGAAGAKTIGLSAPGGQRWVMSAVEVRKFSSSVSVPILLEDGTLLLLESTGSLMTEGT